MSTVPPQPPAPRQDRLKQLRAFCFAAQAGSISRAAERLGLSQPSVSLQVQALERELGITVLERRGPRIRLTPDGERLYELAQPLVEGVDALPMRFADRSERVDSGRLDIAAGESTTLYLLPGLLRRYMDRYPGVHIKLHNIQGRELGEALRQDQVDFAVGSMLDLPDDVNYRAIYSYGLSLISPRDHPLARRDVISLRDLAGGELIVPPRQLTTWRLISLVFQQHSIPYRVRLEVGGWETIKRYVELGFGIAIVSNICLTGEERVAVRSLPEIFPKRTYGVMVRRGRFLSPQAKAFIELMKPDFFEEAAGAERSTPTSRRESVFIAADGVDAV